MKILLASDGSFLIKQGYGVLGIPIDKMRIGYVTTASKVSKDRSFVDRHKQEMSQAGYYYEEFDIEGKSREEMLSFFTDKNVIHIEGGNTFYLLKLIRETGFDEILKTLLDNGLFYIGTSAGAYVMCPTIEVASWKKDKKEDWFGLTDFTGLSYVPFCLKVHYTDDMQQSIVGKMRTLKYPLRILRDGQGIIGDNGQFYFKGEGEEVKLSNIPNEIRNTKIF